MGAIESGCRPCSTTQYENVKTERQTAGRITVTLSVTIDSGFSYFLNAKKKTMTNINFFFVCVFFIWLHTCTDNKGDFEKKMNEYCKKFKAHENNIKYDYELQKNAGNIEEEQLGYKLISRVYNYGVPFF